MGMIFNQSHYFVSISLKGEDDGELPCIKVEELPQLYTHSQTQTGYKHTHAPHNLQSNMHSRLPVMIIGWYVLTFLQPFRRL